ncbi:MAG: hypothetical protein IPK82_30930 [Polyangiaceae bacterium]|nr:hypothetical protein [Polyangiaceae bacterium]
MNGYKITLFGVGIAVTHLGCALDDLDDGEVGQAPAALVGTINPMSNTDGRELAGSCAASVTAPMSVSDLVSPQTMTSGSVTVSGGSWASATRLTANGPIVNLTRVSGIQWKGVGFFAQNGMGSIAPGGPANHMNKAPLLLQVRAMQGAVERGKLRFWTYQGLKPAAGSAKFDEIGVPDGMSTPSTLENTPAYMGIVARNLTFDRLEIQVMNPAALSGPWTIDLPKVTAATDQKTCWHADANWRLVSNSGEYDGAPPPPFTHLLRTESHETHKGHTVGHYWEFNVYANPNVGPASGSILQNSAAAGNLTSPAVQLRDIANMCDQLGQGDLLGLYHWSHFHFQGYHETDDAGYGQSGIPFDPTIYCNPNQPENPYSRYCEGFLTCKQRTNLSMVNGTLDTLQALGDLVCGATCLQAMQVERDACLGSPVLGSGAPPRDQRLGYYSLNNGRTWRRINHMNNRYHNGYPGEWHYNHAHPHQDSDGMLGTDHEGFDWDQDGMDETSSTFFPAAGQADTQFGYLPPNAPVGVNYVAPAMRFRFRFEEKGSGPCKAGADNYCAGWRLDDFGLDYNEECQQDGERYFDTLGDPHVDYVANVTEMEVDQTCAFSQAAALEAAQAACTAPDPAELDGYGVVTSVHQHDTYVYDADQSQGCSNAYQNCTKHICVESEGALEGCYTYERSCGPTGPNNTICCQVTSPWVEAYCQN